jgi:hypothetical protein
MKRSTFIILSLLLGAATANGQQWANNGNNIYNTNTGSVLIGAGIPNPINGSAGLFPSSIPKFEIYTGSGGTTGYADIVTIRHPGATLDVVTRQMGLVLKLSSESSTTESDKMGGMLLESSNGAANAPTFSLITANLRRLTIDPFGNIGINTTDTKGYKLGVNGNIIANSIVVKVYPWADYVFYPEYHLQPLKDLKAYIDKNKHLPEIPSAQEVADKGVDLGEMNKLLLKKVEELTLYLIEKDLELKAQSVTVNEQQKLSQNQQQEIDELKKQVASLIRLLNKRQ